MFQICITGQAEISFESKCDVSEHVYRVCPGTRANVLLEPLCCPWLLQEAKVPDIRHSSSLPVIVRHPQHYFVQERNHLRSNEITRKWWTQVDTHRSREWNRRSYTSQGSRAPNCCSQFLCERHSQV